MWKVICTCGHEMRGQSLLDCLSNMTKHVDEHVAPEAAIAAIYRQKWHLVR